MKFTRLLILSLGLSLGISGAAAMDDSAAPVIENVWAKGLSATYTEKGWEVSGWYDAQKTSTQGDMDDNMCYAASAANLLAWWQNGEDALESEAPRDLDAIWKTLVDNNQIQSSGGDALSVINWWMSGVYAPTHQLDDDTWSVVDKTDPVWDRYHLTYESASQWSEVLPMTLPNYQKGGEAFGGYYFDEYGLTQSELASFIQEVWSCEVYYKAESPDADGMLTLGTPEISKGGEGPGSIADVDFEEILKDSAISLTILSDPTDDEDGLAHAITLWGVEYQDGELTMLWLTDSDDYEFSEDDVEITEDTIFTMAAVFNENDNKIYLGEYDAETGNYESEYGTNVYIGGVYALDTTVMKNRQLVPEPTTATLSLLALVGLAARRRRRR